MTCPKGQSKLVLFLVLSVLCESAAGSPLTPLTAVFFFLKSAAPYPDQSLPRTKRTRVCLLLGRVFYSFTVSGSLRTRILSFFSLLWVQVEDWTQALIHDKHLLSCCLLSSSLSVTVPFYFSGKPDRHLPQPHIKVSIFFFMYHYLHSIMMLFKWKDSSSCLLMNMLGLWKAWAGTSPCLV